MGSPLTAQVPRHDRSRLLHSAIAAGLGLLYFGVRLGCQRTRTRARQVVLASVLYLPAILAVMVMVTE
jgi:heme O synthase-like polyprenyltransferase